MTRPLPPVRFTPSLLLILALLLVGGVGALEAQRGVEPSEEMLRRVFPGASIFTPREGTPPVIHAYAPDENGYARLVGYAFLTSDIPPEEMGYNGPIEVLVGMNLQGVITGAIVTHYRESLQETRGDFLGRPGFQEQFAGKRITEPFRVRRDVDGVSGASITVGAMALGIRNSARRVAQAYLRGGSGSAAGAATAPIPLAEVVAMNWGELLETGLVLQVTPIQQGMAAYELSLIPVPDPAFGEALLGEALHATAMGRIGEREGNLLFVGIDGGLAALFRTQILAFVQEGDTIRVAREDASLVGVPRTGIVDGHMRNVGLMRVDARLRLDRPLKVVVDGRPGVDLAEVEWRGWRPIGGAVVAAAEVPAAVAVPGVPGAEAPTAAGSAAAAAAGGALGAAEPASGSVATPEPGGAEAPVAPGAEPAEFSPAEGAVDPLDQGWLDFAEDEEETLLARTFAQTSWARLLAMVGLLALVARAFRGGEPRLRWVTLGATVLVLGFSGGFLSVSHIAGLIKVGPSVFLSDLPLLLLASFTLVTTVFWGRVFCGYLCPFGALQDVLERVVPKRFRVRVPEAIHRGALKAKYGVLGIVLLPALLGSPLILFQYFEPFGTVFFLTPSLLLWAIALAFLCAAAVIPRFYCRYACPLGAALAVGSLVAPFRIRRVPQCSVCTVCEQRCPTGIIHREAVTFHECVRCGDCDAQLERKAGVCRHDMERVQPRLVQLRMGGRGARIGVEAAGAEGGA